MESFKVNHVRENVEISCEHGVVAILYVGDELNGATIIRFDGECVYLADGNFVSYVDVFHQEH